MKKRILVFGDSNTWGWKPDNLLTNPPFKRWSDWERWTGVMQASLGEEYQVINEGLNGRTTVWDDPIEEYRCGKEQLVPILDSQAPIDLVIIALGSNDLKRRFSVSARDIAEGAGLLVGKTLQLVNDFVNQKPHVILVCPPRLGPVKKTQFAPVFGGNEKKSEQLAPFYKQMAELYNVAFFNADEVIHSSDIDGLHLDQDQHYIFGKAMAEEVKKNL